ncbi:Hypothetical protein A7982_04187 [Minicystis rosea]|nr:Hypothetical protein A7982_04187 [Minicystis rosea]
MKRLDATGADCDPDPKDAAAACVEVHRSFVERDALGLGPAHPDQRAGQAQLALCERWERQAPLAPLGPRARSFVPMRQSREGDATPGGTNVRHEHSKAEPAQF